MRLVLTLSLLEVHVMAFEVEINVQPLEIRVNGGQLAGKKRMKPLGEVEFQLGIGSRRCVVVDAQIETD